MPYRQDINSLKSDLVDEAVIPIQHFADRVVLIFRYDPASAGLLANTVPALDMAIDKVRGIRGWSLAM